MSETAAIPPAGSATTASHRSYAMAPCCASAALAIGHAIFLGDGIYESRAIWWLAAGIALAWVGLFVRGDWKKPAIAICVGGIAWQVILLSRDQPLGTDGQAPLAFYTVGLPLLGLLSIATILATGRRRNILIALLLLAHFTFGVGLLRAAPKPYIDVFAFTKEACEELSQGKNPYAMTFRNIYWGQPDLGAAVYAPGVLQNGRVQFGYQYMPLSLIVAWIGHVAGHWVGGDFRLGNLFAFTLAGGLLAFAGRGALSAGAAAVLLLTPRGYYVVERGWSEPVVACCLAAVVLCAARQWKALPWMVGLLLVSKQHAILAAPAVLLVLPRPWCWKTTGPFIGKAILAGAVVTLPMVLWDVRAFWHSAVVELLRNPFRIGSLNFAAVWAMHGHDQLPGWLAYIAATGTAIAVIWRAPRSAAGLAIGAAIVYLSFFAFAKQAFGNYYFVTIAALCGAVAAADNTDDVHDRSHDDSRIA